MSKPRSITAALMAAILAAVPAPQAFAAPPSAARTATHQPLSGAELDAFVSGVVQDAMRSEHISGVSLSIVQDGRVVLARGYGAASRAPWTPVTADTLFRIGSTSKTFTWIALMREVEAGRVRLDAPVNTYLPPEARFVDTGLRPILVRDLMSHSAGLEDLALGHMIPRAGQRPRTLARYIVEEQPRRVRQPGELASYCNYCAVLAGAIVARLERADYETVIERDITGPLGMTSTSFRDAGRVVPGLPAPMPAPLAARLSQGFSWKGSSFEARPPEVLSQIAPAGGAASSAADMSRYMTMLLNGGSLGPTRVFGPSTAAAFRTPLLKTTPGISGWDHGFMQIPLPGGHIGYGHDGDTTLFHTSMVLVPDLGLGVSISANTDTGGKLVRRLPALLMQHFYAGQTDPEATAPARIDQPALQPYAGDWIGTRRTRRGVEGYIDLLQGASTRVTARGLVTDNGVTWIPEGAPGRFRQRDGARVLSFDLDHGKPVRWRTEQNADQQERMQLWERPELLIASGALTLLAALATLGGLFVRPRPQPLGRAQAAAGMIQSIASAAWLASLAGLGLWVIGASDSYTVLFGWPGPFITIFAWAGLVAAALSLVSLALLVPASRSPGWSGWRKLRYAMTTVIFCGFAALTAIRGGLDVWSL